MLALAICMDCLCAQSHKAPLRATQTFPLMSDEVLREHILELPKSCSLLVLLQVAALFLLQCGDLQILR